MPSVFTVTSKEAKGLLSHARIMTAFGGSSGPQRHPFTSFWLVACIRRGPRSDSSQREVWGGEATTPTVV